MLNENKMILSKQEDKALLDRIIMTVVSNISLRKLLNDAFGNEIKE